MSVFSRSLSRRAPLFAGVQNLAQQSTMKPSDLYQNYANSLLNKYGGQYGNVSMVPPQQLLPPPQQPKGIFGFSDRYDEQSPKYGFTFGTGERGSA